MEKTILAGPGLKTKGNINPKNNKKYSVFMLIIIGLNIFITNDKYLSFA